MNATTTTTPVYLHPPPARVSLHDILTGLVQVAFLLLVARQFQLHEPEVAKELARAVVANYGVYGWVTLCTSALLISCAPYIKSLTVTILVLLTFSATAFFIFGPKERIDDILALSSQHFDKAWVRLVRDSVVVVAK